MQLAHTWTHDAQGWVLLIYIITTTVKKKPLTINDLLNSLQDEVSEIDNKTYINYLRIQIERYNISIPDSEILSIIEINRDSLKVGGRLGGIKILKEYTRLGLKECKGIMDQFNEFFNLTTS
jgi:ribosomal protein L7/L12